MTNNQEILTFLYNEIFDKTLNSSEFDDRLTTQKMVYLLNEKGISCGDYNFCWDTYGPFCFELNKVIKKINLQNQNTITFECNSHMTKIINEVKEISKANNDLLLRDWMELVASVHYLIKYRFNDLEQNDVLCKLKELKPRLGDIVDKHGVFAYKTACSIM